MLEIEVNKLKRTVHELTELLTKEEKEKEKEKRPWKRNTVLNYMIKLVHPEIYCQIDNPKLGFPKNRRGIAQQLSPGHFVFIYVTSPEKKIIGLTKVVSNLTFTEGKWPYSVDLEWIIPPKLGLSLRDLGLDMRPRPGDTIFGLTDEKAQEIIGALNSQDDLDDSTLMYLNQKYSESEGVNET
ncbi:hypothetical protein [Priestia endophytica]|uniref:hypothetical protein n=1 Tax=Priestia endophytica TaxID=135735 RepID=UPI00124D24A1|nr:hypothetical protein [Priestia endophytica]KAB2488049.1 hypothetical protein F8155_25555 [Priestia endophytica]